MSIDDAISIPILLGAKVLAQVILHFNTSDLEHTVGPAGPNAQEFQQDVSWDVDECSVVAERKGIV